MFLEAQGNKYVVNASSVDLRYLMFAQRRSFAFLGLLESFYYVRSLK